MSRGDRVVREGRCAAAVLAVAALVAVAQAAPSNVGRRLPPEKRTVTDAVTGLRLTFLTTDPANDSKPYQTDPTWTADGRWILMRSARGSGGPQAFLLDEQTGDILQVTDGTNTSTLALSRKTNKLFLIRGGPVRGAADDLPRRLVEVSLTR